jgi:hypothetical protein
MDTRGPDLREQANRAIRMLTGLPTDEDVADAKALVGRLRDARDYDGMGKLAEAISRRDPHDPTNRRLYAQYFIDTGKVTAAIDVLRPLLQRLPKSNPERGEVAGLIGRSYKQIFFDAGDKTSPGARDALKNAIHYYRGPFEDDPKNNTWHGVNLAALLARARGLGYRMASNLDPRTIAQRVVDELSGLSEDEKKKSVWYLPTLAEALLGLGEWSRMEETIRAYADVSIDTPAFVLASTLRQFTQVWDLEQVDDRGRALVEILRARLARAPDSVVELTPKRLMELHAQTDPDESQLEAVLGPGGVETYEWWETGRQRALSVASIRRKLGSRKGTGFLVRAGELGCEPADELVLLTNYHVINESGQYRALTPPEAEVVFEAGAPTTRFRVAGIVWSSPTEVLDATIVRLQPAVTTLEPAIAARLQPLPIASGLPSLPVPPDTIQVYAIGHPNGRELHFSFRGNDLIDHEGPPAGNPPNPARWRVHYTATTDKGSSGSPVFNATAWEVVALHHRGRLTDMPKLNQKPGEYGANQGIAMASIIAAPKRGAVRHGASTSKGTR